ncbi:hypothetical protein RJ639_045913 [Escallonia herrerae]|uniref:PGG domain-containing protein n=1 Tax=Escallonia herrerae TaxID=1293975 RepID=A0AA88WEK8_9ASTE|nr:hypothetical protein RJ639_045913 [Escallonia herrerae]
MDPAGDVLATVMGMNTARDVWTMLENSFNINHRKTFDPLMNPQGSQKEVEKLVNPSYKVELNCSRETPSMVFIKEHRELMIEGEKWMKDAANSCTIAPALVTTVVFAAAITVPGGNHGNTGLPIFSKEAGFIIFAISNGISLFTSTTSLLMFLSILTSALYTEHDFLFLLPEKLIIGLVNLFLSIIFMMVAFSMIIYLVLGQRQWILA